MLKKMKLAGKNALFHYRIQISISSNLITGFATGTAFCLRALPMVKPLEILMSPEI